MNSLVSVAKAIFIQAKPRDITPPYRPFSFELAALRNLLISGVGTAVALTLCVKDQLLGGKTRVFKADSPLNFLKLNLHIMAFAAKDLFRPTVVSITLYYVGCRILTGSNKTDEGKTS